MTIMDLIDTILGPLDLIDRLGAAFNVAGRRDRGVELRILRRDKGGTHTSADVRTLLARYGIRAHRARFDSTHQYIVGGAQFDDVPAGWDQADWSAQ